jgi:hypothetical protein
MKRYGAILAIIVIASCGIYSRVNSMAGNSLPITTIGENAIIDAIKLRSDITSADTNRWGFSWIPGVGSNIRNRMIVKVQNFLGMCQNTVLANSWFNNVQILMSWFPGHSPSTLCKALNNLLEQSLAARALLERFGTEEEKRMYHAGCIQYANNIVINKQLMDPVCRGYVQQGMHQEDTNQQRENNRLAASVAWWKLQQVRWQMVKDMGGQAFNGVKWVAKTANENSAPLLSAAAMWFVYDKLFGTYRWTPSVWNLWGAAYK